MTISTEQALAEVSSTLVDLIHEREQAVQIITQLQRELEIRSNNVETLAARNTQLTTDLESAHAHLTEQLSENHTLSAENEQLSETVRQHWTRIADGTAENELLIKQTRDLRQQVGEIRAQVQANYAGQLAQRDGRIKELERQLRKATYGETVNAYAAADVQVEACPCPARVVLDEGHQEGCDDRH